MITKKEVRHIARLARISLEPHEEEKFEKELSRILDFVEKLNEVDTDKVAPMTGGTAIKNVMRPDAREDAALEGARENILEQAPEKKEGWIKVKAVFE